MTIKVELHKRNVKLPSGGKAQYWTLRWWGTDGRRFSESLGRVGEVTKNEAETARREKEQAIGGGRIKRNRPREVTLSEFVELDRESIRGTVKLNTVESIKHSAAHALKAWGGTTKLTSIGRGHVGRLKTYLLDEAKVSETTVAKTLRTLKAMLNRALKDGLIHENPLAGVRMPKAQARPKRIFSPDETRAMRGVASDTELPGPGSGSVTDGRSTSCQTANATATMRATAATTRVITPPRREPRTCTSNLPTTPETLAATAVATVPRAFCNLEQDSSPEPASLYGLFIG